MKLRDFLAPERMLVPLGSTTVEDAGDALFGVVAAARGVLDGDKLRRRILDNRVEDVVAMGDRAFLMHYRTDAVGQIVVAMGVARSAITRLTAEGETQRARIVLLIATPPRQAVRYLQLVGGFARLLRKADVLEAVLASADGNALASLPAFEAYALPEQLAVRDVMNDQPRTIGPDVPLKEAARTLVRTGLGALPVVDADERVIGLVSEREVIRHLVTVQAFTGADARVTSPGASGTRTVRDVMTRQVLCVAPQQPIAEVAALMSNRDVDRVPVVRDGRLVGFLTRGDIVRKLIGS
jgi:CBS domain-containing protein